MVRHLEGLLTGITDYWFPAALDRWRGGFRAPDPAERPLLDRQVRTTVQQARHTWFLARLARSPYGDERHLAAATHGVQYLRTRLWDDRHGGFVWGIRPRGRVVDGHKHAYAQAFAVLALSEYARAAGDATALDLAATTLDVLAEVARDDDGYAEVHGRDWGPCVGGPMQGAGARTLNTHLHLLEAVLAFIAAGAAHAEDDAPLLTQPMKFGDAAMSCSQIVAEVGAMETVLGGNPSEALMDGEHLASVVSPYKADPLIESAKAIDQQISLKTSRPTQKHPHEADHRLSSYPILLRIGSKSRL